MRILSKRFHSTALALVAAGFTVATATAHAFTHPGLINNQAELNKIKASVNGSAASPMKDGWNKLLSTSQASLSYQHHPYATVWVKGSGSTPEESQIRNDAIAAYADALQWVVTGDSRYSQKAIQIMTDWGRTIQEIKPTSDSPAVQDKLETDWYAPMWLNAAEIIRYYNNGAAGWSSTDRAQFDRMVAIFRTKALAWDGSQGCCPNQALSVAFSRMSIGVYADDQSLYDNGLNYFRNSVLARTVGTNGEILELNRISTGDCGHASYDYEGMIDIAETAWHQGTDLYQLRLSGDTSPRLLKGIEYMAQNINSGTQTSQVGYLQCSTLSPVSVEIAFNQYARRLSGYSVPQTQTLLNKVRPSNQGSGKFIPWDTLTHAEVGNGSGSSGAVTLYQNCNYGGWSVGFDTGSYTMSDMASRGAVNDDASSIRIPSGYQVTLYQNDNYGGSSVTLTGDNSCLTGVNFNDTVSSMVVSQNSCTATPITPYLQVSGGSWQQTASATLSAGTSVKFGPQPTSGGSWSWTGCGTSGTSREQTVSPSSSCTATATYKNDCGAASTQAFTVTVSGGSGGGGSCSGVPQFVNGHTYNTGDVVQNVGNKYQCTVGGWCSQGGAYEPGVGWAWTNAWNQAGSCS